jgi:hypothetical protein
MFALLALAAAVGLATVLYQRRSGGARRRRDQLLDMPDPAVDQRLDEGLKETFPASDPVAIHID